MVNGISTDPGPYCELHAHSCYSLLDGVPFPEALAERAAALGLPALALTDHDALYGIVPFYRRAQALGVKPIVGVEVTAGSGPGGGGLGEFHLTLLAENHQGYQNLCRLVTLGRAGRPKGQALLAWEALAEHTSGLICLTGCKRGPVAGPRLAGKIRASALAHQALEALQAIFRPGSVYVELQRNLCREDQRLTHWLAALAQARRLPVVATGNVHYLERADGSLQDALVSIRERVPLPHLARPGAGRPPGSGLRPNHEFFLRSPAAMADLFADLPEAIANTRRIAERCSVSLPQGLQVLPTVPTPGGVPAQVFLRQICEPALGAFYTGALEREARTLLEKELGLIERLGLANYFLVVWDIVNYCKQQGILCHGRGSAANSLVARLLGISAVDPIAQGLVLERFLSVEHGGTPDIDLDIDAARRERVIQYVYERWGRDQAAMACTYITFRTASALRDAGFALGFQEQTIEQVARLVETGQLSLGKAQSPAGAAGAGGKAVPAAGGAVPPAELTSAEWQRLLALAQGLLRRPRHLGLHNGGMVVAGQPIAQLVPVEPAAMEDRTVVQFDKEQLEELGIVKIDLLGLRMLAAIADTLDLLEAGRGTRPDLHRLSLADPAIYAHICTSQTIGIFQVESGAQVSLIPHLQPRCFQDLVVEISLIRPGPLQGNMVKPYLHRRQGLAPVSYAHPRLKNALADTLGVIVFQEQVIKVARDFAGFTPGRGELLRRALGHKHASEALAAFRQEFIEGALSVQAQDAHPRPPEIALATAEQVWQMIESFAGYSFSKAHAAAFAVIVYWSAWLRVHCPVEYFCGLLRNAPLGTYPANVLEAEARRVGVKFLPFDINRSLAKATVVCARTPHPAPERGAGCGVREDASQSGLTPSPEQYIRYGLDYVKGIGEERAEAIVQVRGARPFTSLADCVARTGLERRAMEALILAGGFDELGERRQLLWDLAEAFNIARRPAKPLPLDLPDEHQPLAPWSREQKLIRTYATTGVTVDMHLVEVRRDAFARAGCLSYRELQKQRVGARVRAGGLVADGLRRPPTAKGTSFLRLEDVDGMVDVIVPPKVYAECRAAMRCVFLVIDGRLQKNGPVLAMVAERIRALEE
jgi:error-prone DNA polymerase